MVNSYMFKFELNLPPNIEVAPSFLVTPTSGIAMQTVFTLKMLNYIDQNNPFRYFSFQQ